MFPSAPVFRAVSAIPKATQKSTLSRVGTNFLGWSVVFSTFMGWPLMVQAYEYKVYGKKK